jgi:hypothetical protein
VPDKYLTYKYNKKLTKKQNAENREEIRKIDEKTYIGLYQRLNEEAGTSAPLGEWNVIRSHNMRRYFDSTLLNVAAPLFFVDYCMGHQLDATHDGYYRGQPEKVRKQYIDYMHHLIIQPEPDKVVLAKYEEEVKRNKELENDALKIAVERSEYTELKHNYENLEANMLILMKKMSWDKLDDETKRKIELLDTITVDMITSDIVVKKKKSDE